MKIQREKEEKLRLQRKQEEKDRWWAGVEVYKPNVKNRISSSSTSNSSSDHIDRSVDNGETNCSSANNKSSNMDIVNRYTADYSRWNDWIPTDDASKAEIGKDTNTRVDDNDDDEDDSDDDNDSDDDDDDDDDDNDNDNDDNNDDDVDVMLTIVRFEQLYTFIHSFILMDVIFL
jgi:hypothetical protein